MKKRLFVKISACNRGGGAISAVRNDQQQEIYMHIIIMLKQELGKRLRTKEVAQYLGLNEKTVRLYYQKLGGMRVGRRYMFFERRLIDAISERTKMGGPSAKKRKKEREAVQYKKESFSVGGRDEEKAHRRMGRGDDPYNLLA